MRTQSRTAIAVRFLHRSRTAHSQRQVTRGHSPSRPTANQRFPMRAWVDSTSRFRISAIPWMARPLRSRRHLSDFSVPQTAVGLRFASAARPFRPALTDWGRAFLLHRCIQDRLLRRHCCPDHSIWTSLAPLWTPLDSTCQIPPSWPVRFPNPRLSYRSLQGLWHWAHDVYIGADSDPQNSGCKLTWRTSGGGASICPQYNSPISLRFSIQRTACCHAIHATMVIN